MDMPFIGAINVLAQSRIKLKEVLVEKGAIGVIASHVVVPPSQHVHEWLGVEAVRRR